MSFKKLILKFAIIPAILIVILCFMGLLYIQNQWKYDFNETEMNSFVTRIKSSKPLPLSFHVTLKSLDSNIGISMSRRVFYLVIPRFMSRHGLHKRIKNNYEKVAELLLDKNKKHLNSIFAPTVILVSCQASSFG
jgi:hypothetical protein